MTITRVTIRNFRGLEDVDLRLDRGSTYLVGENNAGKTSVLHALAVAFGARRATRDDLRQGPDDEPVQEVIIDVHMAPIAGSEFDEPTRQRIGRALQREPGSRAEVVAFRTVLAASGEGPYLTAQRTVLQAGLDEAWVESKVMFRSTVLELVSVHFLDAARDLVGDLRNRASAWGRIVADLGVTDLPELADGSANPLGRLGLEEGLHTIATRIHDASPVLSQLEQDLGRLADSQTAVGSVQLRALPARIEELAQTIDVVIKQRDESVLPLRYHGLGSRSLAALLVFQTLCTLRVGVDQGLRPRLLTLMEEPEAHLHPQAVVALRKIIEVLPGQQLVTTHSPQLVAEVSPSAVRLVRRTGTGAKILNIPEKSAKQIAQFRRFVERPLGEVFFARLVVFGDGTTERNALPILLTPLLGCDPAGMGITFIDTDGMGKPGVSKAIGALEDLEIPWLIFSDNDQSGRDALAKIEVDGHPLDVNHPNVILSGIKQMEQLLIDAGYGDEIEEVAREVGIELDESFSPLKFLSGGKGWVAEEVARRAVAAGRELPQPIKDLSEAIRHTLERSDATAEVI